MTAKLTLMKTKTKILLACLLGFVLLSSINAQTPADSPDARRQRITEKVERVKEGVQQQMANGRNPSAIAKAMQETIRPLMESGKVIEAEAELDRLLEQLKSDGLRPETKQGAQSFAEFSPDQPQTTMGDLGLQLIFNSLDSPIGRIKSKMQLVKTLAPEWTKRGGNAAKLQSLMEKVAQHGKKHKFVEAEMTVDEILALLGANYKPAANASKDIHRQERDAFIAHAKQFNITGIEEYMGLAVVEPERGKANWSQYREDAAAIKKAGVQLVA